ncbi:hypothetical protein LINPERPRIM_LOCUS32258 [Linum perenne]
MQSKSAIHLLLSRVGGFDARK